MSDRSSDSLPRWFDGADELARALLAGAEPIRFSTAATVEEREAAYRLRACVTIEEGWKRPEELPDGLECDEYDTHAAQIVAWDGETPVATARVVFPSDGRELPTETAFGVVVEPRGEVVDAGRALVAREYRDGTHRILGGLSGAVWLTMRSRGFHWAAVAGTRRTLDLFEALGFEVHVLGEPRDHWGAERIPARFGAPDPRVWLE